MKLSLPARFWFLLASVAFVLTVQWVCIDRPYRGHFASYQGTVMASMARNMVEDNFKDVFMPKTDSLILTSEKTYHLNQYPLPSLLVAVAVKFFGGSFEFWGRFQAILFNLCGALFLWGVVRKMTDEATAAIASILFLISPNSIIYGQTFFCEPVALCCVLASLWLLVTAPAERECRGRLVFSALLLSVALVNRIHFVFFLPPMVFGVWLRSHSLKDIFLFGAFSLAFPVVWYGFTCWASIHNVMSTHTSLLFQAMAGDASGQTSVFSLEYWKRVFDVLALNMLTPLAFPFFLAGLALAIRDARKFAVMLMMLGFGSLTILFFPQKIMDHDFYLQGLLPFVIFFAALGVRSFALGVDLFRKSGVVLGILLVFWGVSARYFLHPLYSFPPRERNIVEIGNWIQEQTRPSDILILAGQDTAALSFYTSRRFFGFLMDGDRQLPSYIKKRKLNPAERNEFEALEKAMGDDISLIEFFRGKGATHLFISNRVEAERNPELLQYLRDHYAETSPSNSCFLFFKL